MLFQIKSKPEDFIHIYVGLPRWLCTFLENVISKTENVSPINYDTLLERTLPLVYTRRYGVVIDKDDLPREAKPRIIKLHGSFCFGGRREEHKPYIITTLSLKVMIKME